MILDVVRCGSICFHALLFLVIHCGDRKSLSPPSSSPSSSSSSPPSSSVLDQIINIIICDKTRHEMWSKEQLALVSKPGCNGCQQYKMKTAYKALLESVSHLCVHGEEILDIGAR